jgi:hypothetical protein
MAKGTKSYQMAPNIRASSNKESNVERAPFNGVMGKFIKGSGSMGRNTGAASGKVAKAKATLGSGTTERRKVLEFIFQSSGTVTRENFKIHKNKGWEHKDITMGKRMWGNTGATGRMGKGSTFGPTETTTKDNL